MEIILGKVPEQVQEQVQQRIDLYQFGNILLDSNSPIQLTLCKVDLSTNLDTSQGNYWFGLLVV